ncbi:MAG TPA: hypothetical protein VJG32_04470 [Anaerolineae bacterium]|nr:hypothetical protein [Anaerolineae bacterium]
MTTGKQVRGKKWIQLICLLAISAPAMFVFGSAQAEGGEPREGHFAAPDMPAFNANVTTGAAAVTPGFYQTSEYLIGRVAVGLILPESDGSSETELSDWTPEQRQRVLDEVTQGLNWWARQAPEAQLTFVVDDRATAPLATGYEPITHPQYEEGLWIGDTLSQLGYTNGSYWTRVRNYVNDLRRVHHTDWAFAIFVVNSAGDADAAFTDNYFAYAYIGGPFLVMTYDNAGYNIDNMDAVTAHETGHVFRALDQYPGANVACTSRSGYLGIETQNSQRSGCASNVSSIMRGGIAPYLTRSIDPYARGQVGWRDSDTDGIFDPVDTIPTLTVGPATETEGTWLYSGRAADVPYPSTTRPAATINHVSVEYSVNGGAWTATTPADGSFDSANEEFSLTLQPTTSGNHRIALRALNAVGNVSDSANFVAVVPDPIDGGLDTWLEPPAAGLPGGDGASALHGVASSFNADSTPGAIVARVEYRVNGGGWRAAQPHDGAFDSAEEGFTVSLDGWGGRYQVEARAIDANGKAEQNLAALEVEANYAVFVPFMQK